jgi:type I restriction enzyme S subunit
VDSGIDDGAGAFDLRGVLLDRARGLLHLIEFRELGDRLSDLLLGSGDLVSALARSCRRSIVEPGDLVFTCWGTVGQLGLIETGNRFDRYLVSNKQMKMTVDTRRVIPLFLYYFLSQHSMIELVRDQAIGSSVPGFNLGQLKALPIILPPPQIQRAIVEVLGALDDKIAANGQIRQLTDELLAAAFVRLTGGVGWSPLNSIGAVNRSVLKPKTSGSLRYIDISSVGRGRYELPGQMLWSAAPGRARRGLTWGDTVWSTVRPNRRSHALILDDDEDLVASTGLAVLTPKVGRVASLYEATRTDEFAAYLESVAEGSAYPAVERVPSCVEFG